MWMRSLSVQSLTVIHWQWLFRQGRLMLPMVWHMQAILYLKMMTLHLPVQLQAVHSMRG